MKLNKLMSSLAIGSALLLVGCSQSPEVASTTAGRIRQDEFYERLKETPTGTGGTVGEQVLQNMLLEDILEEQYGDQVSQEEIDQKIDEIAEPQGGREALEEALAETGTDISDLEQSVKVNLMLNLAVADYADYTEEDLKEYHESQVPEGTRVAHILVEEEEQAQELIDELEDGADFAELAEEHSQDPGSAANGGEYELETGQMVPEFEQAAMELEEGEITEEPVQSSFGYHIITMLEKGEKEDFEDVKDQVEKDYVENELASDPQAVNNALTQLVQEANVNITDDQLQGAMAPFLAQPEEESEGNEEETDQSSESEGEESSDNEASDDSSEETDENVEDNQEDQSNEDNQNEDDSEENNNEENNNDEE